MHPLYLLVSNIRFHKKTVLLTVVVVESVVAATKTTKKPDSIFIEPLILFIRHNKNTLPHVTFPFSVFF